MTKQAAIRWGSWYGDLDKILDFPTEWDIEVLTPKGGQDIGQEGLRKAFRTPIGTPPISEMARGKHTAVIVVDDLTRPTPTHRLLPLIIEELAAAGVREQNIRILVGSGTHGPMNLLGLKKKLGDLVGCFWIQNHYPFGEDLVYLGRTSHGTPVYLNRWYVEADLKICVGSILPHLLAGFSGGAKLVVPGVAGLDTIYANHDPENGYRRGIGVIHENVLRADLEEAAALAGSPVIVNAVLSPYRQIVGCVVGHFIEAHRAGVELARKAYATEVSGIYDAVILSAYPKDVVFFSWVYALCPIRSASQPVVAEGGTVVVATVASEGTGTHFLSGPGMRLGPQTAKGCRWSSEKLNLIMFSPNVSQHDARQWGLGDQAKVFRHWEKVISHLRQQLPLKARIAIFPCAAMQIASP